MGSPLPAPPLLAEAQPWDLQTSILETASTHYCHCGSGTRRSPVGCDITWGPWILRVAKCRRTQTLLDIKHLSTATSPWHFCDLQPKASAKSFRPPARAPKLGLEIRALPPRPTRSFQTASCPSRLHRCLHLHRPCPGPRPARPLPPVFLPRLTHQLSASWSLNPTLLAPLFPPKLSRQQVPLLFPPGSLQFLLPPPH